VDEYFDVVDEQDRVIGRKTRQVIHKGGKWHRAVYIFVFNSKGELFLQKRGMNKDLDPGHWDCSVSGHLSTGQKYYEAALREAEEEIGVKVKPKILFYMTYQPAWHHLWIFEAKHNGPFKLDQEEIIEGRFISMEEIRRLAQEKPEMFTSEFIGVLEQFLRYHGL
jgi:isopentenyldiphosphate isomerase